MEKKVEDMTVAEIKALKRKYKKELRDILEKFFEDRSLIKQISFNQMHLFGSDKDHWVLYNPDNDNTSISVYLFGEK